MKLPLDLDWIIHEPNRMGVVLLLAETSRTFTELAHALRMASGLLDAHLRLLEAAEYVERQKESGRGRQMRTRFTLTPDGHHALTAYAELLLPIVTAATSQPGRP